MPWLGDIDESPTYASSIALAKLWGVEITSKTALLVNLGIRKVAGDPEHHISG